MLALLWFLPPVAQDPAYHRFADQRVWRGIANFMNVASSGAFIVAGAYGCRVWRQAQSLPAALRTCLGLNVVAAFLIACGSTYYHLAPNNASLVVDRLPMALTFMVFGVAILGDCLSLALAARLLWPAVALGIGTVLYWYATELLGAGDLRPYAVVQALPVLLLPVLLWRYGTTHLHSGWLWATLVGYLLAKLAEQWDRPIFLATGYLSGHSLKHLLAAASMAAALRAFQGRRKGTVLGRMG